MRKIPCLFVREFGGEVPLLTSRVTSGCEWVLHGEGRATVKWDGTACLVEGGRLYKRYDAKMNPRTGLRKKLPPGAIPCELYADEMTGHWPHWVPVDAERPEDRWHAEADLAGLADGTYELCGPAVGGNPHGLDRHVLLRHGEACCEPGRTREAIGEFLRSFFSEGIVFHHPDGRMAKIRRSDFGLAWPLAGHGTRTPASERST